MHPDGGGDVCSEHVLGKREVHRPGPAAGSRAKCAPDESGKHFSAGDAGGPFGDRPVDASLIEIRERPLILVAGRVVGCQGDHGHRGSVGFRHPGQHIGGAPATRALADAGLAGQPCIDVCHKGGRAFVARHDVGDPAGLGTECIIQIYGGVARQPENGCGSIANQHFHQCLGAIHLFRSSCGARVIDKDHR